ncbi:hypothetical protein ACHAPT_003222 [Fusarium lateritium]
MVSQKLFAAFAALSFVAGSEALCRPKSSTSVDVASSSTVATVSTSSTTVATTTTGSASSTAETSSTISTDSTTAPTSNTESASSSVESSTIAISTDSTTLATSTTQAASSTTSSSEPVVTNLLINGDFNDGYSIEPWTSGLNGGIDGLGLDPDTQKQGFSLAIAFYGSSSTSRYVFNALDGSRIVPGAAYELSAWVYPDANYNGNLGCRSLDIYCVWGGLNQAEGHTSTSTSQGTFEELTTTCRWTEEQAGDNPKILFKFECGESLSFIDEVQLVGPLA